VCPGDSFSFQHFWSFDYGDCLGYQAAGSGDWDAFFNPVHLMKLVEVIRSLDTADETLAVVLEVAAKMGKETVVVNESPGFITSRISALVGNEAFYMLMEGVASAADIDRAIKLGLNSKILFLMSSSLNLQKGAFGSITRTLCPAFFKMEDKHAKLSNGSLDSADVGGLSKTTLQVLVIFNL
jgi:hypothetical protein